MIKAFEESEGRVPEIKWYKTRVENGYRIQHGKILDKVEADGGVEYNFPDIGVKRLSVLKIMFTKQTLTLGPLLSEPESEMYGWVGSDRDAYKLNHSKTGLVLSADDSSSRNIRLELRAYSPNIIIFATKPYIGNSGTYCNTVRYDERPALKKISYCSVGYFWID